MPALVTLNSVRPALSCRGISILYSVNRTSTVCSTLEGSASAVEGVGAVPVTVRARTCETVSPAKIRPRAQVISRPATRTARIVLFSITCLLRRLFFDSVSVFRPSGAGRRVLGSHHKEGVQREGPGPHQQKKDAAEKHREV